MKSIQVLAAALLAAVASAQDAVFTSWQTDNCDGSDIVVTANGNGAKGNFNPEQFSVVLNEINAGFHLTLYSGQDQSNVVERLNSENVGQCFPVGFQSWGIFDT
ncbi:hypothetical protein F5Y16DRAFT_380552 [Xylariaceae sp. FL0255]|nr:hypothetical protein F5Y16DRAFT_380552 [Xylariaceae sp. FL0255]